jgi:hypothetical protein
MQNPEIMINSKNDHYDEHFSAQIWGVCESKHGDREHPDFFAQN